MAETRTFGSRACTALLKTLLLIFNALFLLIGALLLTIGIYGLTVTNVLFVQFAPNNAVYTVFVCIGLFMVFVGSLSLWCTPKGITWLLYLYATIVFVLFAVVFMISALLVVRRDAVESSLKTGIATEMQAYSNDHNKAMDLLQSKLSCCGSANYTDWESTPWSNQTHSVPKSCCRNTTACHNENPINKSDIYERGCYQLLENLIERNYAAIGGIGFASSILIFFGSILACSLSRNIQQSRYEQIQ